MFENNEVRWANLAIQQFQEFGGGIFLDHQFPKDDASNQQSICQKHQKPKREEHGIRTNAIAG